jgi:hypothetical protein
MPTRSDWIAFHPKMHPNELLLPFRSSHFLTTVIAQAPRNWLYSHGFLVTGWLHGYYSWAGYSRWHQASASGELNTQLFASQQEVPQLALLPWCLI